MDSKICLPRSKEHGITLIGLKNTSCFLDNILIVSKGSEEDHFELVSDCLKNLDADNLRINFPKCHSTKQEILWPGYKLTQSGISPLESKTSAFFTLQTPTTLNYFPFLALYVMLVIFSQLSSTLPPFKTFTSLIN